MNTLFLFGKKYLDTIMFVDGIENGETNTCTSIVEKIGGLNNFKEADISPWKIFPLYSGSKKAYIVSDRSTGKRTSYVINQIESFAKAEEIQSLKNKKDWLHICYLDDIECYTKFYQINIPYSIDFCTDNSRAPYFNIMNKASVIFDSRERKQLYDMYQLIPPLILHDEYGFEIIKLGKTIYTKKNTPIPNLNVNGAGDIFAALFLKYYISLEIFESAEKAMLETTKLLLKRKENEQKI